MRDDWGLIARGLGLAALGAVACMLYIVAASACYVGRFSLAASVLGAGAIAALAFRRLIGRYLESLDQRDMAQSNLLAGRVAVDAPAKAAGTERRE